MYYHRIVKLDNIMELSDSNENELTIYPMLHAIKIVENYIVNSLLYRILKTEKFKKFDLKYIDGISAKNIEECEIDLYRILDLKLEVKD